METRFFLTAESADSMDTKTLQHQRDHSTSALVVELASGHVSKAVVRSVSSGDFLHYFERN